MVILKKLRKIYVKSEDAITAQKATVTMVPSPG